MPGILPRAYHLAAAALVALAPSATAFAAVHDVHTHRLDNGVTLHVAPGHPAPVAAVQAWLGVGSADEAAGEAGMAHVVEHMLFKGSAGYGLGELVRAIERGGGEINAWTSFDHTVYHAVLGADHVDAAIHALGDALIEPLVDPDELAREREVILEEIRQGSDDPARGVAQSLFATAFAAHPYRRPVIGTAASVARIGERELLGFFRRFYVADNLRLVVAGDVDPERVQRAVERRFRAMPSGRPQRLAPSEPPQTEVRAAYSERDVAEAHLAVGFHVPAARHPDLAPLDVAAIVLGQGESARLPRLVHTDELATSAYATLHTLRDPGLLVLSATSRPDDAPATLSALVERSAQLVDDVTGDELDKARIAVETAVVRQLETAQGRARSLGWHASVAGDPQFGHVYLDRIRAVRRHDVARVLRRYLRPDNASVAAILPATRRAPRTAWARQAERRVARALATTAAPPAPVEQRVVLASGVTLVVRRDPSVPVVAMRAVWRGGQRIEDAGHAGASALLARMLTRGCGARDAAAVADHIDRLGGALSGVAGRNSFGVAAEWLARSWQAGFELMADCILSPAFDGAELIRERRLMIDDARAQDASPAQVAFRLFSETLYGAHPYARDALGSADAIAGLSRAELAAFYRERYPLAGLTLAIAGDIDLDEVIAAVTRRLGQRPAGNAPAAAPAAAPGALRLDGKSAEDREVYRFLDRAQAHLVIGFPGATVDAADRFALEVLVAILGGQSGRLFAELRDRRALAYRVSAHSVEGVDPGFVAIYLSCAPDKLGAAVAAVRDELARLRTDGVTAAEVERAQSYLIGSHRIAMQRRAAVANAMAYHEAYGLGWQSWAGYDGAIRAVTPAAVAAAIASYLRDDRAITATVRPPAATPGAKKRSRLPAAPAVPARHPPPRPRGNV